MHGGLSIYRFGSGAPALLMPGLHSFQKPGDRVSDAAGFWKTFLGVALHPVRTLDAMEAQPRVLRHAFLAFALIVLGYTSILTIFIGRKYPAAARSVLPLCVDEQYRVQIWYQGPLFAIATLAAAGFLEFVGRHTTKRRHYAATVARMSFASVVPFFFTTFLVESSTALLVLAGVRPAVILGWLTGSGAWFALTYQLVGMGWLGALFVIVARLTTRRGWGTSVLFGLLAAAVYGAPIALFIR